MRLVQPQMSHVSLFMPQKAQMQKQFVRNIILIIFVIFDEMAKCY